MYKLFLSVITFHICLTASPQSSLPALTDSIDSKILNETRGLQVILPKEYKEGTGQKYEVVYILDGEWYYELVPNTYNFAESAHYIPKSIFVLIRNRYFEGKNLRDRDFSPTKVPYDSVTGGADRFYDFVTKEVVPYVEKKYPVSGQRTLVGSSYSGLFSVYAFLKDPSFFQSFVASDPNLVFDNNYVTRIATDKFKSFPSAPGTLFIGCLTQSWRDMGSYGFDSVLRNYAPKNLHWKIVHYDDESHYSVQLKAFYDAFRFSHFGYGLSFPEFHPMTGLINSGKPFTLFFLNENPAVRFTSNGSEPDSTSKLMVRTETTTITAPAELRIKNFAYRPSYSKEWVARFSKGTIDPVKADKNSKSGLSYALYSGKWDSIPSLKLLQPVQSGKVDSLFNLNSLRDKIPYLVVVEGVMDITNDAEYIFYTNGYGAAELSLAGKSLFKVTDSKTNPSQSYVASLSKGKYPVRLVILKKADDAETNFLIFQSKPGSEKWWENVWMKL